MPTPKKQIMGKGESVVGGVARSTSSSKSISKMSTSELRARAALLKNQEALNKRKIADKNKAIVDKIKKTKKK